MAYVKKHLSVVRDVNSELKRCLVCDAKLPEERAYHSHAKYCSDACARKASAARYIRTEYEADVSPSSKGAITELLVCSDLLSRGYSVFRSMSASSNVDLIAMNGRAVLRVEVKTATLRLDGAPVAQLRPSQWITCDCIAICARSKIWYYAPRFSDGRWSLGEEFDFERFFAA